ncbi:Hint domain-containing protein [Bordetella tumulicola]|uniref:Hint domain-containing protein n=1 Tax=Bordetella tumulicola TaxID=1649133 RepID=UPI0039F0DE8A
MTDYSLRPDEDLTLDASSDPFANITPHGPNTITVDGSDIYMNLDGTSGEFIGAFPVTTINATNNANVVIEQLTGYSIDETSLTLNIDDTSSLSYGTKDFNQEAFSRTTVNFTGDGGGIFKLQLPPENIPDGAILTGLSNGDALYVDALDPETGIQYKVDVNWDMSNRQLSIASIDPNGNVRSHVTFKVEGEIPPDAIFEDLGNGRITFKSPCYLRGTHIATLEGEKPIEDLQPGDQVRTVSGRVATVKWVGYFKLHSNRIPAPHAIRAYPICITAGALAPRVPTRDLYVSPGHHMYFDGKLIPALLLVNGKTITQDFSRRAFEYFHVELDRFDIILAEGAAAESYVDAGNRSAFQNVNVDSMLTDFGPAEGRPDIDGIQIARSGSAVEAVRKHLLKRAAMLTRSTRVNDPDLKISVNGQEILPDIAGQTEGVMRFVLPSGIQASDLHIVSRSAVVRETTWHARRDLRRIGVALASITIEDARGRRQINVQDRRLRGLQPSQDVRGVIMRWTTGNAIIPATLHAIDGPAVIELDVRRTYSYWAPAQKLAA